MDTQKDKLRDILLNHLETLNDLEFEQYRKYIISEKNIIQDNKTLTKNIKSLLLDISNYKLDILEEFESTYIANTNQPSTNQQSIKQTSTDFNASGYNTPLAYSTTNKTATYKLDLDKLYTQDQTTQPIQKETLQQKYEHTDIKNCISYPRKKRQSYEERIATAKSNNIKDLLKKIGGSKSIYDRA